MVVSPGNLYMHYVKKYSLGIMSYLFPIKICLEYNGHLEVFAYPNKVLQWMNKV